MQLKPGRWYYFEILGDRNYLYVSDEDDKSYYVTHYFKKENGVVSSDKGDSYVQKRSRSLNSYSEISKRRLIKEVF